MSLLKGALIFGGLGGGIALFMMGKYKRLGEELVIMPAHRISNFNLLKGFDLELNITIKNPTDTGLKVRFPFMRIMLGSEILGSSGVESKVVSIPPYSQTTLDKITIPIKRAEELDVIVNFLIGLSTGETINASLITDSAIVFGFLDIPFQNTTPIPLSIA